MNTLSLKTKAVVVVFSLALLVTSTTYPHRAYAFLGVGDVVAVNLEQSVRSNALNPLAYTVAKIALNSLSKSVVNWVNSGFNGSPAFVQDLNQTLLSVGDAEATRFIDQFVNSGTLQDVPWKDDIAQTVLSGYLRSTSNDGFALDNPYTLNQVSEDPQAFVNGDWSKGGLDAWMSLVLNPANSPRGLLHITQNALNSRVSGAKDAKTTELSWSNGFNSFRGKCPDNTSGTFTGGGTNTGGALSFSSDAALAKPPTVLSTTDTCAGQPILTPGSLISQAINKHLVDSGVDQYISADSIGEIVSALMGQLVGNVLGGGGLAGVSAPTSGGGRSYIDKAADPSTQTAASASLNLSNSFLQTLGQQTGLITQYKTAWTTIGTAASQAKAALSGASCPLVDSTISDAGTNVGIGTNALNELQKITTQFTLAVGQDPTSQQTVIADATASYEALQAGGTLPSSSDISYAISEGVERQAGPGTSASLLTRMNQMITSKTCQ